MFVNYYPGLFYCFIIFYSLLFFEVIVCEECNAKTQSQERLLKKDLLCDYDRDSRPRENSQDSVNVTIRLIVKNFNFEDTTQTGATNPVLSVGVWVVANWKDDFLIWSPKDYGNHEEVVLNSYNIWIPDLSLYNSVEGTNLGSNVGFSIPCLVKYTGAVTCIPHMVYETICKPNYKNWPVDRQNCSMTFGTWMNKGEEVRFTIAKTRGLSVAAANTNPYWNIIKSGSTSHSGVYDCCPNSTYPTISFWMLIERKAADGIIFLVTPALVMVLLTITSLLLDINSMERIALMILNLYYHLITLKGISESAPVSGDTVPNAVAYFRDSTYLACVVLVEGILLKNILKRTDVVPRWVSFMTSFMNSGAGKIIMFHEFDPAATAIISGDPETLNKEEMDLVSKREWMRFTLLINRIFLIVVFITYVGLVLTLLLF